MLNFIKLLQFGTPVFSYKNPLEFGKLSDFNVESSANIQFDVLDSQVQTYDGAFVYNNVSSPITLTYINKDVKTAYQFYDSTSITYDGRLLKTGGIDLSELDCEFSFRIIITTIERKNLPMYFVFFYSIKG